MPPLPNHPNNITESLPTLHSEVNALPELHGEVDPSHFLQSDLWVPLAWGCVILVALVAAALIWWIRRRQRSAPLMPTPLETALAALRSLEEKLPPLRECSLQLSLIVRHYLQGQVQDPALFETHEEFSQRLDSLATVPRECQYDTRYLLEQLADLKYAGTHEQDPVQARTLIEQARALLTRIDQLRLQAAAASLKQNS